MVNGPMPPQQSYQQHNHLQDPVSRSANVQQHYQYHNPTQKRHNPIIEAPEHIPRPHHRPTQPVVLNNDHYGKKWPSSQPVYYTNNSSKLSSKPIQKTAASANGSLPSSKIPVNSPILLMLSGEVREWKFLGRYLDLEEEIIDEIDYNTIPNKTRDKALKVLKEWVDSTTPTWQALGEALLDAEYIMLYEKLLELISGY